MTTTKPYTSPELRQIIQDTLKPLNLWSENVEELLVATCAQESLMGLYRVQGNNGPAKGIFQMEKNTHDDIWINYLNYRLPLLTQIKLISSNCTVDDLVTNDKYAVAMARVQYLRASGPLPVATDLTGLWNYYKAHYNSVGGAATQSQFFEHYHRLVSDGKAHV